MVVPGPFTSVVQMYPLGRVDQVRVSYLSGNKYSVLTTVTYCVNIVFTHKNSAYS